ncbi:hypothetical protein C8R42DRAFT_724127 [Lentinula raphanica]|nr:hypothetical protein C8R42DRAFT_724127 [Lentinula raphanica]KAJ3819042.1 hypothetical protein F5880DRAFT_1616822 [Lentinula raphanica]
MSGHGRHPVLGEVEGVGKRLGVGRVVLRHAFRMFRRCDFQKQEAAYLLNDTDEVVPPTDMGSSRLPIEGVRHFIAWSLGLVTPFLPGAALFIPSAPVAHANALMPVINIVHLSTSSRRQA